MNGTGLLAVIDMLGTTITQLQERNANLETAVAQLTEQIAVREAFTQGDKGVTAAGPTDA